MRHGRRRLLAGLGGVVLVPWWCNRARAADVEVPIPLQIDLLAKVVKYDRNAADRMKHGCRLLLVRRADNKTSEAAAAQARTEIAKLEDIGGEPVSLVEHRWIDTDTLVERCDATHASIVLVTPGLSDVVGPMASAFSDKNLITVALQARDVRSGAVLGFALESSRPTIVVHLRQARRQHVDFSARLLAIAKVIE